MTLRLLTRWLLAASILATPSIWAQFFLDSTLLALPSAPVVPVRYDTKWNPALPLATQADGSWWLAYSDAQGTTRVLHIPASLDAIAQTYAFNGERIGGLTATPDGFALGLARDSSTWSLVAWNTAAQTQAFRRTFIGERPRAESESKFDPMRWGGSRVLFANNTFAAYFAHQQNWADPGQSPDVHQGDFFGFTNASGGASSGGWNWGTSHSLNLDLTHDGRNLVTASLGDAYPKGLTFQRVGRGNRRTVFAVDGDGAGWANGILGQIHAVETNLYAITFATPQSRPHWTPGILLLDSTGAASDTLWTPRPNPTPRQIIEVVRSGVIGNRIVQMWSERDTVGRTTQNWVSVWNTQGEQVLEATPLPAPLLRGDNLVLATDGTTLVWAAAKGSGAMLYQFQLTGGTTRTMMRPLPKPAAESPPQNSFDLLGRVR